MSESIVFYHNPMSRGRIVHLMLEETGAPYTIKLLNFERGEHKKAEYLAINPMGKIPAIVHRGVVITEAPAICTYLADAFPAAHLAPALDDPARGTYLRWMFFAASCVEYATADRMLGRPATEKTSTLGYGTYEDTINTLEKALTPGPYVLGDRFSAVDVYLGSAVGWGMMAKAIEPRPVFQAYVGRVFERPAAKRMLAQTEKLFADLKAQA
jgi:glutathione S-transferase